jgi:hypothetical protein
MANPSFTIRSKPQIQAPDKANSPGAVSYRGFDVISH